MTATKTLVVPMNQQINQLTRDLDGFVTKYVERVQAFADANPGMDQDGRDSIIRFLPVGADRLLRLAQTLDGR